jgi:hypothetical protein
MMLLVFVRIAVLSDLLAGETKKLVLCYQALVRWFEPIRNAIMLKVKQFFHFFSNMNIAPPSLFKEQGTFKKN